MAWRARFFEYRPYRTLMKEYFKVWYFYALIIYLIMELIFFYRSQVWVYVIAKVVEVANERFFAHLPKVV